MSNMENESHFYKPGEEGITSTTIRESELCGFGMGVLTTLGVIGGLQYLGAKKGRGLAGLDTHKGVFEKDEPAIKQKLGTLPLSPPFKLNAFSVEGVWPTERLSYTDIVTTRAGSFFNVFIGETLLGVGVQYVEEAHLYLYAGEDHATVTPAELAEKTLTLPGCYVSDVAFLVSAEGNGVYAASPLINFNSASMTHQYDRPFGLGTEPDDVPDSSEGSGAVKEKSWSELLPALLLAECPKVAFEDGGVVAGIVEACAAIRDELCKTETLNKDGIFISGMSGRHSAFFGEITSSECVLYDLNGRSWLEYRQEDGETLRRSTLPVSAEASAALWGMNKGKGTLIHGDPNLPGFVYFLANNESKTTRSGFFYLDPPHKLLCFTNSDPESGIAPALRTHGSACVLAYDHRDLVNHAGLCISTERGLELALFSWTKETMYEGTTVIPKTLFSEIFGSIPVDNTLSASWVGEDFYYVHPDGRSVHFKLTADSEDGSLVGTVTPYVLDVDEDEYESSWVINQCHAINGSHPAISTVMAKGEQVVVHEKDKTKPPVSLESGDIVQFGSYVVLEDEGHLYSL